MPAPDRLSLSKSVSLTARILAVNIIALGLLAGSLFYLDSYRKELLSERFRLAHTEAEILGDALAIAPPDQRDALLVMVGNEQKLRLRLYGPDGQIRADNFELAEPTFEFIDPEREPWLQDAARALDRGMDFILGAEPIPDYNDPEVPGAAAWPEAEAALANGEPVVRQRLAPDRTPVITAAAPVGDGGSVLLTTRNAPDITQNVRDARQTLAFIVGAALIVSTLLSLFLARTIVKPLRILVRAAVRVRLGRDRAVVVPRLPERRDEIGLLARAISDMTAALRQRIDAVESFAADVAHELKNPLASLRSALESLERTDDPGLREQLTAIASSDVRRIDWLVTEIADASRIDAELSRTTFEPVDMLKLVKALVAERESRGVDGACRIVVAQKGIDDTIVPGDASRLERVLQNLVDNAVSFSPDDGSIEIELARSADQVEIAVSDHGPGIPQDAREKVFERFHSFRESQAEGERHSGLGLAIARTIVEAHYGSLTAERRSDGRSGARMLVCLPAWEVE